MITEYTKSNTPDILLVINDASLKYKGIIPDDCWREPYMTEQKLVNEFTNGVRMFGYNKNNISGKIYSSNFSNLQHTFVLVLRLINS